MLVDSYSYVAQVPKKGVGFRKGVEKSAPRSGFSAKIPRYQPEPRAITLGKSLHPFFDVLCKQQLPSVGDEQQ